MVRLAATRTAMAALIALAAVACSGGDRTSVEAVAPDAVASAVDEVTSGRLLLTSAIADVQSTSELRFDGDDSSISTSMELVGDDAAEGDRPGSAASRSITVDGTTYSDLSAILTNLPPDQETPGNPSPGSIDAEWISQPAIDPPEDIGVPVIMDPLGHMVTVLGDLAVDRSGEPGEVGGVATTRYRIELSGADASKTMEDLGLTAGGDGLTDLAERYPEAAERFGTVQDYLDVHSEATAVVDLDGSGQLVRAEVTAEVNLDEFPRCGLFDIDTSQVQLVLDEVNQPQDIEAPPAEDVITWEEFARTQGFEVPPVPGVPGVAPPDAGTPGPSTLRAVPETTALSDMPTTTFGGPGGDSIPDDLQAELDRGEEAFLEEMLAGCPT